MLKDLCTKILADKSLQPSNGVTHCNQAVNIVAKGFGFTYFDGLMANSIIDYMVKNWRKVTGEEGAALANKGTLVIAGMKEAVHGHVAVLYPGEMVLSGHWGKKAPLVANVGKTNGIMGANFAFAKEPQYWTPV